MVYSTLVSSIIKETGKSLYSSHMIDLSEEPIEENIEIVKIT